MVGMLQKSGMSYSGIAKELGVQTSTIARIAKGARPRQGLYDRLTVLYVKRSRYRRKLYSTELEPITEREREFMKEQLP